MFILNYSIWWLTENRFRRQKKAFIMCNRTEPQTIEPWCHAMQSTQQCLYFNLGNAKKNALITNTIILNSKALPFSSKELLFLPLELKMFKDQVVLHALLQGPNNFCDSHSPPPPCLIWLPTAVQCEHVHSYASFSLECGWAPWIGFFTPYYTCKQSNWWNQGYQGMKFQIVWDLHKYDHGQVSINMFYLRTVDHFTSPCSVCKINVHPVSLFSYFQFLSTFACKHSLHSGYVPLKNMIWMCKSK